MLFSILSKLMDYDFRQMTFGRVVIIGDVRDLLIALLFVAPPDKGLQGFCLLTYHKYSCKVCINFNQLFHKFSGKGFFASLWHITSKPSWRTSQKSLKSHNIFIGRWPVQWLHNTKSKRNPHSLFATQQSRYTASTEMSTPPALMELEFPQ